MKARLIKRRGSFSPEYYAVAILLSPGKREIILQAPAFQYPCSLTDNEQDREGLNDTAEYHFQAIVDKINN